MMGKARTFRGFNTAGLAFLSFLHTPPKTLPEGMTIGTDCTTHRPFSIDLTKARFNPDADDGNNAPMASGWVAVFGDKGSGKSAYGKVDVSLGASEQAYDDNDQLTDASIHVHNRKPDDKADTDEETGEKKSGAEWMPLMGALGATRSRLDEQRLSMLDPYVSVHANFSALMDYLPYLMRTRLSTSHMTALRIAIHRIQLNPSMPLTVPILRGALRTLSREHIKAFHDAMDEQMREEVSQRNLPDYVLGAINANFVGAEVSESEYQSILQAANELANVLTLVLDGMFGKMFTGTMSYTDLLRQKALVLDYGDMKSREIGLLELMRTHSIRYASKIGDTSPVPNISVEEEIHLALRDNVELLRLLTDESSVGRSKKEKRLIISQYPNNLLSGDIGSEEYNLSRQFMSGFDLSVIGQLPYNEENVAALRYLGISDSLIRTMTGQAGPLDPGTMLFAPKNHPQHLIHVLADEVFIREFAFTRSAPARQVLNRRHVEDFFPRPDSSNKEVAHEQLTLG